MVKYIFVSLFLLNTNVLGYKSSYKKPKLSNGPCIDSLETMQAITEGSEFHCLGCNTVQPTCPSEINCQAMIDNIYRNCDQVNLPRRYFHFDPPVSKTRKEDTNRMIEALSNIKFTVLNAFIIEK